MVYCWFVCGLVNHTPLLPWRCVILQTTHTEMTDALAGDGEDAPAPATAATVESDDAVGGAGADGSPDVVAAGSVAQNGPTTGAGEAVTVHLSQGRSDDGAGSDDAGGAAASGVAAGKAGAAAVADPGGTAVAEGEAGAAGEPTPRRSARLRCTARWLRRVFVFCFLFVMFGCVFFCFVCLFGYFFFPPLDFVIFFCCFCHACSHHRNTRWLGWRRRRRRQRRWRWRWRWRRSATATKFTNSEGVGAEAHVVGVGPPGVKAEEASRAIAGLG